MNVSMAHPEIGPEERQRVIGVLESGQLAAGDVVRTFESAFADYCEVEHAIACANGTAALHAALEALDIRVGAYGITTPFSFVATANAIRFAGGFPRFVDIDPVSLNLDPDAVESAIVAENGAVDSIVVPHLFGLPADMDRFQEIAAEYDVSLVEDAAQAHGAQYNGQPVGSFGDVGCFSFYPTKNMTTGEGGMITTDRDDIATAVRQFIDHGRGDDRFSHVSLGHNYRMTEIAAAIGLAQLEKLPRFVSARRENATYLNHALRSTDIILPRDPADRRHAYHQYTVRTPLRETLRERLHDREVETAVYYPSTIPDLESYHQFDADTPIARRACREVVSVPIHPAVTTDGLDLIVDGITGLPAAEVS